MEFKPGAYTKGDTVTVNGIQYVADRDIANALALPKENMYWSVVGPVEQIPPPPPKVIGTDLVPDLLPTNTPEQNSAAFEKHLSLFPEGACPSIKIPYGNYHFARTINIYRKPVYLHGDNGTVFGNSTKLIFPRNTTGLFIDRGGASIQETIIERICLVGGGGDGSNGNGIHNNARIKLRDVTIKGFSQNGLLIWANMEEGGDASGSIIQSCHALENGHDGFFAGRVDGNSILFINCDSRDNGRWGFNDDSFLGNTFIACMAHYNKAADFNVRDWGNARSTFVSCYSEGGNPVSKLGPHSTVIGGIWGSGFAIGNDPTIRTNSYLPQ